MVIVVISCPHVARQVLQNNDLIFLNRIIVDDLRAHQHHELGLPWIPILPQWRYLHNICNSHIFAIQKLDANHYLRCRKIENSSSRFQEKYRLGEVIDIGQATFNTVGN
ncbi:hypothetical protein SLA2020_145570 [Shorea laevis]